MSQFIEGNTTSKHFSIKLHNSNQVYNASHFKQTSNELEVSTITDGEVTPMDAQNNRIERGTAASLNNFLDLKNSSPSLILIFGSLCVQIVLVIFNYYFYGTAGLENFKLIKT
jgi:hypothetical protein